MVEHYSCSQPQILRIDTQIDIGKSYHKNPLYIILNPNWRALSISDHSLDKQEITISSVLIKNQTIDSKCKLSIGNSLPNCKAILSRKDRPC